MPALHARATEVLYHRAQLVFGACEMHVSTKGHVRGVFGSRRTATLYVHDEADWRLCYASLAPPVRQSAVFALVLVAARELFPVVDVLERLLDVRPYRDGEAEA